MQNGVFQTGNPRWSAVFSLFMGVMALIAAEFIPVSLLTPIARDLAVSEGMAGQTVTAVGVLAVLTSLLLAPLTGNTDRRRILLAFSAMLVASYMLIGMAPTYSIMLIGRAILGICVGGFWSLASAVTLQLVPTKDVPRALSIVYAGVSVATIIALPVASWIGHLIGWRNVFFLGALMAAFGFVWQYRALPSLPARTGSGFRDMSALLRRTWILAGIGGNILSFGGYHIFFTYLRPFLELDLALGANTLSVILLVFGVANVLGTFIPVNHDSGPSGLHSRRARLASLPRARGHRHRAGCFLGIRVRLYPGRLVHMDRPHPLRQGRACRRAHRRGDAIRHWPCRRRGRVHL